MNRGGHAWLVADDACRMPFPRQIFHEVRMPWPDPVHTAIAEAKLCFARQGDDELPPGGIVPIAKTTGLSAAKDYTLRRHERREFGMGGEV